MTGLRAARPRRPPWAPISNPACGRDRSLYTGSLYTSPCFIDCLLRSRSIHNTPHRLTMGLQPELARHGTFPIVLCIFCQFCVTKLSIASRLTIWRLLMQKKTSHVTRFLAEIRHMFGSLSKPHLWMELQTKNDIHVELSALQNGYLEFSDFWVYDPNFFFKNIII